MLTARAIMNTSLVHLELRTTLHDAARIMAEQHIGSIIVTANSYPVGIVTETDMTRAIASNSDVHALVLADVMSSPLLSTKPEADITEVTNTMALNHIKKMPVIEHQRVIGIITQTDIIKHILDMYSKAEEQFSSGKINARDFATAAAELSKNVRTVQGTKNWHMRCSQCGYQFLNEERNGMLAHPACPRCQGTITYDQTVPL